MQATFEAESRFPVPASEACACRSGYHLKNRRTECLDGFSAARSQISFKFQDSEASLELILKIVLLKIPGMILEESCSRIWLEKTNIKLETLELERAKVLHSG